MKKSRKIALLLAVVTVASILSLATTPAFAGSGKTSKVVNVADTRDLSEGPTKWAADLYNANLWLYAVVVVVVMFSMGLILGFGFDYLVSRVGLDLGRMEHRE